MDGRLLLDVVVGEGAAVLQLLPCKNQALLVGRDPLLVLDFRLRLEWHCQARTTYCNLLFRRDFWTDLFCYCLDATTSRAPPGHAWLNQHPWSAHACIARECLHQPLSELVHEACTCGPHTAPNHCPLRSSRALHTFFKTVAVIFKTNFFNMHGKISRSQTALIEAAKCQRASITSICVEHGMWRITIEWCLTMPPSLGMRFLIQSSCNNEP